MAILKMGSSNKPSSSAEHPTDPNTPLQAISGNASKAQPCTLLPTPLLTANAIKRSRKTVLPNEDEEENTPIKKSNSAQALEKEKEEAEEDEEVYIRRPTGN